MLAKLKCLKWHLVPVTLVFGLLPLIMRLSHFELDPIYARALLGETYPDFFFFYKGILFIFLTLIMLITLVLNREKFPICRDIYFKFYTLGGLLFIAFSVLSTFLSPYKDLAMVGGPTRYEGLGIMICYIMVMFYCYIVFQEVWDYKYVVLPFAFTTVLQALIGFTQLKGRDFTKWKFIREIFAPGEFEAVNYFAPGTEPWFPRTEPTWQGTLGNSNYSGSFVSLTIPLFLILTCIAKTRKQRLAFGGLTLASIFVCLGGNSRAGVTGCLLSLVLLVLCLFRYMPILLSNVYRFVKQRPLYTLAHVMVVGTILVAFVALTNPSSLFKTLFRDMKNLVTPISASNESLQKTASLIHADVAPNTIHLQTSFSTLIVTHQDGTLHFTDSYGRHLPTYTATTEDTASYVLYTPPYVGYTFEQVDASDALQLLFYLDEDLSDETFGNPLLGFLISANGTTSLTKPDFTYSPIIEPKTLGFHGKERLGSNRGYIWSRSLPLLAETFLVGVGPDMYMMAYPQYDFWGEYQFFRDPYICVDKPHNTYIQFWINQGFFSFLGFILMCGSYMLHCITLYGFKKVYTPKEGLGLAFMSSLFAYLVASFFNDTTLSVTPLFFALLGCGMAYNVIYKNGHKSIR